MGIEEGIALISLNRPKQTNAISNEMTTGLLEAFETVSASEDVTVAILTGKGKAFSVGVDLVELGHDAGTMQSDTLGLDAPITKAMAGCRKPIIAAINGFAVTGGFELALACDLMYAAKSAKFADTHAQVGLIPGGGLSQKLPRLGGINRARGLSMEAGLRMEGEIAIAHNSSMNLSGMEERLAGLKSNARSGR